VDYPNKAAFEQATLGEPKVRNLLDYFANANAVLHLIIGLRIILDNHVCSRRRR
jgi:hypothetical protein